MLLRRAAHQLASHWLSSSGGSSAAVAAAAAAASSPAQAAAAAAAAAELAQSLPAAISNRAYHILLAQNQRFNLREQPSPPQQQRQQRRRRRRRELWTAAPAADAAAAAATAPAPEQQQQQPRGDAADDVRARLLDAALTHVPRLGWTRAALAVAADDLKLSPAVLGLLPRGPAQLVEHLVARNNAALAARLAAERGALARLPLPERVAAAVRARLELNAPWVDTWPQALALLAQPRNAGPALALLGELVDEIWHGANAAAAVDDADAHHSADAAAGGISGSISGSGGDDAGSDWYAKRALLAGVYAATELFMLTDFSPGFSDTWRQLDRRVADALALGGAAAAAARAPAQLLELLLGGGGGSGAGGGGGGGGGARGGGGVAADGVVKEGAAAGGAAPPAAAGPGSAQEAGLNKGG